MAQFPLIDQASLAMIAGAYKEDKVYSQLPTDGSGDFTYTRGTDNATRVNEEGNIEKGYGNLFLQSNSFNTSPWVTAAASVTSNQAGYDGFNDAWKLESTSDGNRYLQQLISFNSVLSISIYAKSGTTDFLGIQIIGGGYSFFNLSNGTLGSSSYTIDNNIELVNGTTDWYRCSFVINANITAIRIYPTNADNNFASTTGQNIYIQDAQLNQGLVAYPYLETTTVPVYGGLTADTPRLDYTDATCPSLLLEPERTNLATNSEYIGIWTGTGFNKNFGFISPEGVDNAYEIRTDSAGGAPSNIGPQLQTSISASTKHTVSAFVKPLDTLSQIRIITFNDDAQRGGGFDFTNNTFTALNTGQETGEVIPFGDDGWYRVSLTYTSGTDISVAYRVCFPNGTVRDGNTAFLLYGLQVEEGSYPSSYIPTYGSTQTRAADNASNTGTINADNDFTMLIESKSISSANSPKFFIGLGYLNVNSSGNLRFRYNSINYSRAGDYTQTFKWLLRKDSTSMKVYLNGTLEFTITSGLPSGSKNISLEGGMTTNFMIFPVALTDGDCIALTTL